jgi:carboxymethylenebutenolidase
VEPTQYVQHHITSGYITISSDDDQIPAFWAHPVYGGTFPGVVAIHGVHGVNPQIRARVRRLAEIGYYVIAPDLYLGRTAPLNQEQALALLRDEGISRVNAALDVLRTHNRFAGKMGVIGWGAGGELAFQVALTRFDLDAAVVFGGLPDRYIERMEGDKTAILAFYGDADPDVLPTTLHRMWQALSQSPAEWQIIVYPEVTNAFKDESSPNYHPYYAADAWNRSMEFMDRLLTPPKVAATTSKRATRY